MFLSGHEIYNFVLFVFEIVQLEVPTEERFMLLNESNCTCDTPYDYSN